MRWRRLTWLALVLMVVIPGLGRGGQEGQSRITEDEAKAVMTDQEWLLVNREKKPTKRVRKWLDVAADRLSRAQALIAQERYADAIPLIEHYTPLISSAIAFIDGLPKEQRKQQRSAYKEFDVRVRRHIPLLMELRRDFPTEHPTLERALLTAQRLRILALNGFSGAEIIKVPEP